VARNWLISGGQLLAARALFRLGSNYNSPSPRTTRSARPPQRVTKQQAVRPAPGAQAGMAQAQHAACLLAALAVVQIIRPPGIRHPGSRGGAAGCEGVPPVRPTKTRGEGKQGVFFFFDREVTLACPWREALLLAGHIARQKVPK
jgi:hypothetical protein